MTEPVLHCGTSLFLPSQPVSHSFVCCRRLLRGEYVYSELNMYCRC